MTILSSSIPRLAPLRCLNRVRIMGAAHNVASGLLGQKHTIEFTVTSAVWGPSASAIAAAPRPKHGGTPETRLRNSSNNTNNNSNSSINTKDGMDSMCVKEQYAVRCTGSTHFVSKLHEALDDNTLVEVSGRLTATAAGAETGATRTFTTITLDQESIRRGECSLRVVWSPSMELHLVQKLCKSAVYDNAASTE